MASSMAAIVSGAGRKLPGRWPWAIISGVHPSLFLRFQILISAPRSANSGTSFARLWYAAPCMTVSPFLSTAEAKLRVLENSVIMELVIHLYSTDAGKSTDPDD